MVEFDSHEMVEANVICEDSTSDGRLVKASITFDFLDNIFKIMLCNDRHAIIIRTNVMPSVGPVTLVSLIDHDGSHERVT